MGKIRLFLSLVPSPEEIEVLKEEQEAIRKGFSPDNLHWEDPEKFHLTLRFLGDMDENKVEALINTLDRMKFDFGSIEFTTDKIGLFPDSKYPNVIYEGLKETGNNSEVLVGFIDKIIHNFGIKPDKRFIPHITIGRFNRNKRTKITEPPEHSMKRYELEFESFCLMQSRLTPAGSVYDLLSEFNFRK